MSFQSVCVPVTVGRLMGVVIDTCICSDVHWSRLTDFTLEMWTPRLRWMPAQRIHMNTPRFHDAHRGPVEKEEETVVSKMLSKVGGEHSAQ